MCMCWMAELGGIYVCVVWLTWVGHLRVRGVREAATSQQGALHIGSKVKSIWNYPRDIIYIIHPWVCIYICPRMYSKLPS